MLAKHWRFSGVKLCSKNGVYLFSHDLTACINPCSGVFLYAWTIAFFSWWWWHYAADWLTSMRKHADSHHNEQAEMKTNFRSCEKWSHFHYANFSPKNSQCFTQCKGRHCEFYTCLLICLLHHTAETTASSLLHHCDRMKFCHRLCRTKSTLVAPRCRCTNMTFLKQL